MRRASLRRVLVAFAASGLFFGCGDDQVSEGSATETGGSSGEDSTSGGSGGPTSSGGETTGATTAVMTSTSAGPGSGSTTSASGTTTTMTTGGGPNSPPNAVDDHYVTWQKQVLSVGALSGLLANDDDPDGDAVLLIAVDAISKAGGKVEAEELGGFSYIPPASLWGEDQFSYTIWDQADGFAEATVRISVNPSSVDLEDVADGFGGFAIDGEAASDYSGNWVDGAGDVDGDGLDDLIIGARFNDIGGPSSGSAYVVFGKSDGDQVNLFGLADTHDGFAMRGEGPDHQAGICVAPAGDVDGDGLADVLVGAHQVEGQGLLTGRGYVVFGRVESDPFPLASAAIELGGFMIDGADKLDFAGRAISSAGDVDGDGFTDLLIGAYGASPQGTFSGSSYVILGGGSGNAFLGKINDFGYTIDGEAQLDFSGHALAGGGDVDGDGLDDVIIGAYGADPAGIDAAGRAYVVFGDAESGPVLLSDVVAGAGGFALDGQVEDDHAGAAVAILGDVNGDGFADLAVGAPLADFSGNAAGRTYVIFGEAAPKSRSLAEIAAGDGGFVIDGQAFRDYAGFAVDGAGDVNGDGLDDIVIGAYGSDLGGMNAGRAFIIFGKTDTSQVNLGLVGSGQGGLALVGEAAGDMAGISVGGAGDVNGDGFADVIVGAFGSNAKGEDAGRSYVFFGGDYSNVVTHRGGLGNQDLKGSAGPDVMIGGAGADKLRSEGGADVLYGGSGDDQIELVDDAFKRIDGGSGVDRLRLLGGFVLDLTQHADTKIRGVEAIELGAGDTVILELRDLRRLCAPGRELTIDGVDGSFAEIDLSGGGFVDAGVVEGYVTYESPALRIRVAQAVDLTVTL